MSGTQSATPPRFPRTHQQLLSLAWAEGQSGGSTGKIMTSTYSLLRKGLVEVCADGLSVTLTPAGRQRAAELAQTPAGQAYQAWGAAPDTDGQPYPH